MRLSAEIISQSEQRTNPLGEREILIRGLSIPSIEHLAVTRDLFDAIDLTDNLITKITNFPKLNRLSSLSFAGNVVDSVDGMNLKKNVPNLKNLNLVGNKIQGLHVISSIGGGCPNLETLALVGNPVTKRQHYRLYTINKIPSLKVLDFMKIKDAERAKAQRLAMSSAGAALEGDVQVEAREAAATTNANKSDVKTFTPGEGQSAKESFVVNFTKEQKIEIKNMIANANSPAEIERIEQCVKRGEFPSVAS
mmetsp:Transcript_15880/g.23881  ORF Transcript_15880/g.23881 Transcript_15880/m.23881 type:complete len:251 (-) Transcript_15880:202-954(-)